MQNPFLYSADKEFEFTDPNAATRLAYATAYSENIEQQFFGPSVYGLEEARWEAAAAELFQAGPAAAMAIFGGSPIWSTNKAFPTPFANAQHHYQKHKHEFPEYKNYLEYLMGAHDFIDNPPSTALIKTKSNGIAIYDPVSGIFAVSTFDGVPRTMYRPQAGVTHTYPTNLDYFYAQQ